ncbi:MAG: hypothetical protein IKO44_03455 [Ruminococcus sp.]|nr:hypothetical protein [Ruminococcus sp.]
MNLISTASADERKNRMKARIMIIAAVLALSACAGKANSSEMEKPELAASLSEDREAVREDIINSEYDNLIFAGDFSVSYPASAAVYEMKPVQDMDKNADKLFACYFGEYDPSAAVKNEYDTQLETDERFALITPQGSICVSEKSVLNRVLFGTGINYLSTEIFDQSSSADEKYKTGSEKLINEVTAAVRFPNKLEPYSYSVQTLDDGTQAVTVHNRMIVGGLPVFDLVPASSDFGLEIAELTPSVCNFTDASEAKQFTVGQGFEEMSSEPCEVMTPEAAMDLTGEKLSAYAQWEVRREELMLIPMYTDSSRSTIRLSPYWVIWFCTDWWHESFAAVNAVTGEVYYSEI